MKARYRLKKNYQYNFVYKKGESVSDGNLVVIYCRAKGNFNRFGFSVSKKFGKAVKRNRIRRQLKECATILIPRVKKTYNFVIVPRATATKDFHELFRSMEQLLASADLLESNCL